jgi:hypothetical protein
MNYFCYLSEKIAVASQTKILIYLPVLVVSVSFMSFVVIMMKMTIFGALHAHPLVITRWALF